MNVLVMGGTQFNGLALVHELARAGHAVTILNRGKTEARLPSGIRRLQCDRREEDAMRALFEGESFDCVFDISAYLPRDVELMVELIEGRTGHYIFASSTVIYGASDTLPIGEGHPVDRSERQNDYGLNKLLCEDILVRAWRERHFPASVAAFSMVFGPNNIIPDREQRMYVRLLQGRKVLVPGDGTTLGQIGHVEDQARALRMMMQKPATFGRRYNMTGGDYYSDEGYVDTFAEVMGLAPEKVFIPAPIMDDIYAGRVQITGAPVEVLIDTKSGPGHAKDREAAEKEARSRSLFQINRIVQRLAPHIHHWNRSVLFSVDRLRRDTGWEPQLNFRAAVEHTWEWMQATGRDRSLEFDFDFEDELIARIESAGG